MWQALCKLLDLHQFAALGEDERSERRKEIEPHLRKAIARFPYDELYQQLEAHSIAFGPVRLLNEVLNDVQITARRMTVTVDGPHGPQKFLRQPLMIDGEGGSITRQAPELGQHNIEIFGAAPIAPTA